MNNRENINADHRAVFVGSGAIGMRHLRNWNDLFPQVRASLVARKPPPGLAPGVAYFESLAAALREGADFVFLSSPAVFHLEGIRSALEAGAHVFCEKPLAASPDGLGELLELAEASQRVLFVGYNLRHHACIGEMRRAVNAGAIGKPLTLFSEAGQHLPDWRPQIDYRESVSAQQRLGGGALLELSHEIDLAIMFGGREIEELSGRSAQVSDLELDVEDYANMRIEFGTGLTAMIHLDFIQNPGFRRCRIIGTRGALEWNSGAAVVVHTSYESGKVSELELPDAAGRDHSFVAQMRQFVEQVERGVWVSDAARDAVSVVEVVERLKRVDR